MISIYLIYSVIYRTQNSQKDSICNELKINIVDAEEYHYLTENYILNLISRAGLSPVGKKLNEINTTLIKNKLEENRLIKRADCFKTVDGIVRIKISQRIPVLRIFSIRESYYIDNEGEKMPVPDNFATYVPIASGYIDDDYAKNQLFEFALFLNQDKFWNSQIKQIYVAQNRDIELTPAVGNHQVILGKIENYKENLEKLRLFYEKGLSKVGWDKFSVINLKFKNQVVCTKKE